METTATTASCHVSIAMLGTATRRSVPRFSENPAIADMNLDYITSCPLFYGEFPIFHC